MRNLVITSKLLIIALISALGLIAYADGDEKRIFNRWFESSKAGVSAVKFQQYNDICGSCHFPYQPGLLPALSWEQVMMGLDNHFGQPVQLTTVETRTMMRYLLDNSAGHVNDEVSNQILQSLKYNPVPIRITQTPYWQYRHKDLDGPVKQSPYQCNRCHQNALQGKYDNHSTRNPVYSQKNLYPYDLKM